MRRGRKGPNWIPHGPKPNFYSLSKPNPNLSASHPESPSAQRYISVNQSLINIEDLAEMERLKSLERSEILPEVYKKETPKETPKETKMS